MDISDICFFDTETRAFDDVEGGDGDVKEAGTYRYAKNSYVIILTYAIGDGPVRIIKLSHFNQMMDWPDYSNGELRAFYRRAQAGVAWFAAWNMGFDRQAWNNGMPGTPPMTPEMTIDVMAQAVASNLPPALEGASRFIGRGGKQDDGKALIKLFCSPNGATPQSHPEEWKRFCSYAVRDTNELREVFRATRPLSMEEWAEYWASERINDRGMAIDLAFCERARAVAQLDEKRTNQLLRQLTDGEIKTVGQSAKLADWVYERLTDSRAWSLLLKDYDEDASDDDDLKEVKLSLERSRVTKLITYFEAKEKKEGRLSERDAVTLDVLRLREFGASAAPKKFDKMLTQHDEGALRGGYVWNGAAQTGRFSSKGVQVHNMTRSVLGRKGALEPVAIEMINDLEV